MLRKDVTTKKQDQFIGIAVVLICAIITAYAVITVSEVTVATLDLSVQTATAVSAH